MKKIFVIALGIFLLCTSAFAFDGEEIWREKLDHSISTGIVKVDGVLFLGDNTGRAYAIQAESGARVWEFVGSGTLLGTPCVVGDLVIFAQAQGEITALKISDGSEVWSVNPGKHSAPLADGVSFGDGKIFVAKNDSKLYALDPSDGKTLWTYQANQPLQTAPYFDGGLVFQGEYDGIFSMIDANTGERLNGGGAGGAINTPAVSNGNVYFSSWDGSVNAVQIKDVIPLWHVKVDDPITTAPEISGGKIFVGTVRGNVVALNQETGKELWKFETKGGSVLAKPAAADGLVFAGSGSGNLYVLDAKNGSVKFAVGSGKGLMAAPLYSEGVIYFGDDTGYIYSMR